MDKMQKCGGKLDDRRLIALLENLYVLHEKAYLLEKKIIKLIKKEGIDDESQPSELVEFVDDVPKEPNSQELRYSISVHLKKLGIPTNVKGYKYLKEGIAMIIEDSKVIDGGITKVFYPEVANKFNSTSNRVERAIRHAIEKSCENVEFQALEEYFGEAIDENRRKPTNSQFLSTMVERVQDELNSLH